MIKRITNFARRKVAYASLLSLVFIVYDICSVSNNGFSVSYIRSINYITYIRGYFLCAKKVIFPMYTGIFRFITVSG